MSILNRTVYYTRVGGTVKFLDWAHVVTSIGMMAEPFIANARFSPAATGQVLNYDPSDIMARVDDMQEVSGEGDVKRLFAGVHGGNALPRVHSVRGLGLGST